MPIGGALKLKGVPINKDKYVQHTILPPAIPFHDDDDALEPPNPLRRDHCSLSVHLAPEVRASGRGC